MLGFSWRAALLVTVFFLSCFLGCNFSHFDSNWRQVCECVKRAGAKQKVLHSVWFTLDRGDYAVI